MKSLVQTLWGHRERWGENSNMKVGKVAAVDEVAPEFKQFGSEPVARLELFEKRTKYLFK